MTKVCAVFVVGLLCATLAIMGYAQVPTAFANWTNKCDLPWGGGVLEDGGTVTAFLASSACPSCTSETRSCSSGTLSGSYSNSACSVSCASCNLPWGGSISHGQSTTAWNTTSSCGGCSSQTRTCSNGSLSGSFASASCTNTACASCSLPWGGSISHGQSVTAYQDGSSCGNFETRTCSNGSLSGSYQFQACDPREFG